MNVRELRVVVVVVSVGTGGMLVVVEGCTITVDVMPVMVVVSVGVERMSVVVSVSVGEMSVLVGVYSSMVLADGVAVTDGELHPGELEVFELHSYPAAIGERGQVKRAS